MHTHRIQTKFTFGDRVRFDSKVQRCSGTGKVVIITFGGDGATDYMIELDEGDIQGGIQEDEIALLTDEEPDVPAVI